MTQNGVLFTISSIQAEQTYPLRAEVLLKRDEDACTLPGDHAPTTIHLAVQDRERIVAIASLCEDRPEGSAPGLRAWRLRGMAVHASARGLGFGRLLVHLCLRHAQARDAELVWCTARESAHGFYEKLGFAADPQTLTMASRPDLNFYLMRHSFA
ncbi:GNAT family N-acetyltransferase [Burkholderia stagnalis]